MADGEGKDIFGVLMGMNSQMNRVEAKLDGLVSHERMAEVVNVTRNEWRNDIRSAVRESRDQERAERQSEIQKSVSDSESRLRADIRSSNAEQDKRNEAREALIANTAKSVRIQFVGIIGMALTGLAYALYNIMIRGA